MWTLAQSQAHIYSLSQRFIPVCDSAIRLCVCICRKIYVYPCYKEKHRPTKAPYTFLEEWFVCARPQWASKLFDESGFYPSIFKNAQLFYRAVIVNYSILLIAPAVVHRIRTKSLHRPEWGIQSRKSIALTNNRDTELKMYKLHKHTNKAIHIKCTINFNMVNIDFGLFVQAYMRRWKLWLKTAKLTYIHVISHRIAQSNCDLFSCDSHI